jgi:hypothetical protein
MTFTITLIVVCVLVFAVKRSLHKNKPVTPVVTGSEGTGGGGGGGGSGDSDNNKFEM